MYVLWHLRKRKYVIRVIKYNHGNLVRLFLTFLDDSADSCLQMVLLMVADALTFKFCSQLSNLRAELFGYGNDLNRGQVSFFYTGIFSHIILFKI